MSNHLGNHFIDCTFHIFSFQIHSINSIILKFCRIQPAMQNVKLLLFFFALFATDHTNWFIDMLLLIFKSPRFLDNKPLTFSTTLICIHCHYIYTYRPFIILFFGDFLFCYRSKESEKKSARSNVLNCQRLNGINLIYYDHYKQS